MKLYSCCVICGVEAVGWHGYIVFADSHEEYAGWCRQHIDKEYANPILLTYLSRWFFGGFFKIGA